MPEIWAVVPTRLPLIVQRCPACGSDRFQASGRFRVNANQKRVDAWLLALCTTCGATAKLSLLKRVNVRSVPADVLDGLHGNDPDLVAQILLDHAVAQRNRITLDWDGAWRLETSGSLNHDADPLEVAVRFQARIPVRPLALIAEGLGCSRSEVHRLIAAGQLTSPTALRAKVSDDFGFRVVHRGGAS